MQVVSTSCNKSANDKVQQAWFLDEIYKFVATCWRNKSDVFGIFFHDAQYYSHEISSTSQIPYPNLTAQPIIFHDWVSWNCKPFFGCRNSRRHSRTHPNSGCWQQECCKPSRCQQTYCDLRILTAYSYACVVNVNSVTIFSIFFYFW